MKVPPLALAPRPSTITNLNLQSQSPSPPPRTHTGAKLDALAVRPASITLDYLELYGLRTSVEQIAGGGDRRACGQPACSKPNEQRIVNFLLRLGCPSWCARPGCCALREAPRAGTGSAISASTPPTNSRALLGLGLRPHARTISARRR